MALCHMTQLTNRNWQMTVAVMNDAQLSKDFDGLCLAKGILIFALSPAVIHSIAFSVVLSIYFAQKTNGISNIDTSFVCLFSTAAHAFGPPRPISGSRDSDDVTQLQNVIINIEERKMIEDSMAIYYENM